MFRLAPRYITPSLRPKTAADIILLALFFTMGTVFWISDGFQIWIVRSLGFGWIPALIFLISIITAIRFAPLVVLGYWKWWVIYLSLALLTIGALSYNKLDYGLYAILGLSGVWLSLIHI